MNDQLLQLALVKGKQVVFDVTCDQNIIPPPGFSKKHNIDHPAFLTILNCTYNIDKSCHGKALTNGYWDLFFIEALKKAGY